MGSNPSRILPNTLEIRYAGYFSEDELKKGNNMVTKYVKEPLGMGRGAGLQRDNLGFVGTPSPKLWIATAISAGAGLATSLLGGVSASRAAKAAERRQRAQEAKEDAWYTRRYNEDYLDTAAGQNLVRRAKDYAREQWKKAAGAQAVAGGTDAATAMAKEAGNKMVGDTIANIAATDQQRKAQVDNMHRQAEAQSAQMDMNRELQRAQNITNASQSASNAIMSVGSAVDQASAAKPSLQGGSNDSKPVTTMDSEVGKFGQADMNKVTHFAGNSVIPEGDYTEAELRRLGL